MATDASSTGITPKRQRLDHYSETPGTSLLARADTSEHVEKNAGLAGENLTGDYIHCAIIRDYRKYLVEKTDLTGTSVLDHLVQSKVINQTQLQAIKIRPSTNLEQVSSLLDHLDKRPYADWQQFLTCLKESQQEHIVQELGGFTVDHDSETQQTCSLARTETSQHIESNAGLTGENLSGDDIHCAIIRDYRKFLVEKTDLTGTSILDHLVESKVLNKTQLQAIKNRPTTNLDQVSALLDHLDKRPYEDWQEFLACLKESQQGHIVQHLDGSKFE